jgi:hypothetical protein
MSKLVYKHLEKELAQLDDMVAALRTVSFQLMQSVSGSNETVASNQFDDLMAQLRVVNQQARDISRWADEIKYPKT